MKKVFYTEAAYLVGLVLLAVGAMFMEKSDFGVSMILAPAYILYRWLNPLWSWFSFGVASYCYQAILLAGMSLALRRFRISYLLSFVTAFLFGLVLDAAMAICHGLPTDAFWQRAVYYGLGVVLGAAGVSMMFRTYLPPEAYELLVKEVSAHLGCDIHRCKLVYDCVSCAVSILMSFAIFGVGQFVGVKWGTPLCALVNGVVISLFSRLYQSLWEFRDALPWRPFFTGEPRVGAPVGGE